MKTTKKYFIPILTGFCVLAIAIAITLFATKKPQELRQKAATPQGPDTIFLSPINNTVYVGQSMTVRLMANLTGKTIDGIQAVANITGTIPSDLTYTPATIDGLDILAHGLIPTTTGKRWELIYKTFDLSKPYTGTGIVSLGTLTFTGNQPSDMTITFDTTLTKIAENKTTNDIVKPPEIGTYHFIPTPTNSPTNTPTVSPTRTPTPTPPCIPLPECVYNPPIVNGRPVYCSIPPPHPDRKYCPRPQ